MFRNFTLNKQYETTFICNTFKGQNFFCSLLRSFPPNPIQNLLKRYHQNNYKIPDCTNNEKVAGLYQKYCSLWHALAACALAAVFPNHSPFSLMLLSTLLARLSFYKGRDDISKHFINTASTCLRKLLYFTVRLCFKGKMIYFVLVICNMSQYPLWSMSTTKIQILSTEIMYLVNILYRISYLRIILLNCDIILCAKLDCNQLIEKGYCSRHVNTSTRAAR